MNAKEVSRGFDALARDCGSGLMRKAGPKPRGEVIHSHPPRLEPLLGFAGGDEIVILLAGSNAAPDQVAPPRLPGNTSVSFSPCGVKMPPP